MNYITIHVLLKDRVKLQILIKIFSFFKLKPFRNQDYYQLKSSIRGLFDDPVFPANNHSIGLNYLRAHKHKFPRGVKWLRAHVIDFLKLN